MTALRGAEGCGRAAGPLEEFIDQIIDLGDKGIAQGAVIIGGIAADIYSASGRLDRSAFFGGCQSQIDGMAGIDDWVHQIDGTTVHSGTINFITVT